MINLRPHKTVSKTNYRLALFACATSDQKVKRNFTTSAFSRFKDPMQLQNWRKLAICRPLVKISPQFPSSTILKWTFPKSNRVSLCRYWMYVLFFSNANILFSLFDCHLFGHCESCPKVVSYFLIINQSPHFADTTWCRLLLCLLCGLRLFANTVVVSVWKFESSEELSSSRKRRNA